MVVQKIVFVWSVFDMHSFATNDHTFGTTFGEKKSFLKYFKLLISKRLQNTTKQILLFLLFAKRKSEKITPQINYLI